MNVVCCCQKKLIILLFFFFFLNKFCLVNEDTFKGDEPFFFFFVLTITSGEHIFGSCLRIFEDALSPVKEKNQHFTRKTLCCLSRRPIFSFCKKFLSHVFELGRGKVLPFPIECYISRVINDMHYPCPNEEVRLVCSGCRYISALSYRRPPKRTLPEVEPSFFSTIFFYLDIENIIKLVGMILLEQKVVLHCHRVDVISEVAEALLSFIFPFRYTGIYVPLIPPKGFDLEELLGAPCAFLFGVTTTMLECSQPNLDMCCVADLNRNTVTTPIPYFAENGLNFEDTEDCVASSEMDDIPPLPASCRKMLSYTLRNVLPKELLEMHSQRGLRQRSGEGGWASVKRREWQVLSGNIPISLLSSSVHKERIKASFEKQKYKDIKPDATLTKKDAHAALAELVHLIVHNVPTVRRGNEHSCRIRCANTKSLRWTDAVRCAFFEAFVSLFLDFRKYIRRGRSESGFAFEEEVIHFDDASFLHHAPKSHRIFLQEIISTQMFMHFIENTSCHDESNLFIWAENIIRESNEQNKKVDWLRLLFSWRDQKPQRSHSWFVGDAPFGAGAPESNIWVYSSGYFPKLDPHLYALAITK